MKHFLALILFFGAILPLFSQSDSITELQTVLLNDNKLADFSTGQQLTTITDSLLNYNQPSLTSVLNYNTPIYFKENGLGMVSSPSFRGTTAQQTAVIWNGININSQFNGQTDFNTINAGSFNEISVRPGGGSIIYGTGAIGGTVHLNNRLSFSEKMDNQVHLSYGSFNTLDARYRINISTKKWTTQLSVTRNQSDNDYDYPENDGKNLNGEFYNTSLNTAIGYRFSSANIIRFYSQFYDSERHFSLIRPSENRTKYDDVNSRNLLEWEIGFDKFTSLAKIAYLEEEYKYFQNIKRDNFSSSKAKTWIAKYDLNYDISSGMQLNGILSYNSTTGVGTNIAEKNREITSASLLFKHQPLEKIQYELSFRKEVTAAYESPFLYAVAADFQVTDFYLLQAKISKNFRIPTFNDLYWSTGGNPTLAAEEAQQFEIGNKFSFNSFTFSLTGYYNSIENMIRWLPSGSGFWQPENVDEVETYGAEILLNWKKNWKNHQVQLNGTYAYTVSENKATENQLIYVPYHKATTSLYYQFKNWFLEYQFLFNGEVFTRTDNNSTYNLEAYSLSNVGFGYHFNQHNVGIKSHNIFDAPYQNVENRPMPGRYYSLYITLNF
ncbi:TonB-dependent receptor plug domain-containing protein [Mesonia maritima]|uniref:Iron complex outermembrane receptor protein n=1 Tax=Mesonia maritima TaxID=1793873 RepID=A0ABU1K562_9FLAO|nr:TonB-dependent receptor [Mesonia maritima]MDR6300754.1 iron complex outermembrane receptor protein [Mesonia maritima]